MADLGVKNKMKKNLNDTPKSFNDNSQGLSNRETTKKIAYR